MVQAEGKTAQNGQIGRSFEVENPPFLLGEVVVGHSDALEGLFDLVPGTSVHAMGLADKGHHDIAIGSFLQDDLGMAGGDDLRVAGSGDFREQIIDVALAKDFQVGVGLVQKQHGAGVRQNVAKQEEHLLAAAARGGKVQFDAGGFAISQRQLGPFLDVDRIEQGDIE